MCTCPSGLALKDGFLCVNKSVVCSELQFACLNGKCVLDMDVCDKENDCGDNSDESSALCGKLSSSAVLDDHCIEKRRAKQTPQRVNLID